MSFRPRPTAGALAPFAPGASHLLSLAALCLLALSATNLPAQYSTPVGKGAAKPKTLRATAVLEWTGPLDKPTASRLMPVAVWDGEHYQPAGLYLARPDPLALESGTQYQLERAGDPVGLYNVRAAALLNGLWEGIGRFQAEAPPPPPPRLKPSKHLPVLSNGKPDTSGKPESSDSGSSAAGNRPTLHRKTDNNAPAPAPTTGTASTGNSGNPSAASTGNSSGTGSSGASSSKPSATSQGSTSQTSASNSSTPASGSSTDSSSDSSQPTLHRRTGDADSTSATGNQSTTSPASNPPSSSGSDSSNSDSNAPTLHRRDESSSNASKTDPDADTDRPTLHKHTGASSGDDDDRPTLHRAPSSSAAAAAIDPDRPRLRYGAPDESSEVILPTRLKGMPPDMQQVVAVSDSGPLDQRPYQYHWPSPDDAAKMQAALAALAEQAIAKPNPPGAKPAAQFGPAARAAARKAKQTQPRSRPTQAPPPTLVDAKFAAYELTFSGGPTLVYTAHTADPGPQRVYVTLIAQPDFSGNPQVLLQQVAHGDRLDETPAMQLVDAVDTDGDQRAELIFQLTGASMLPPPDSTTAAPAYDGPGDANAVNDAAAANAAAAAARAQAAVALPEREFAIYRVANGKAVQVFDTGPLP